MTSALSFEALEALDFIDLCIECDTRPSRIRALVADVDIHDECAVEAAIRSGIHRIAPSLDDYAYMFVRHFFRSLELLAAE